MSCRKFLKGWVGSREVTLYTLKQVQQPAGAGVHRNKKGVQKSIPLQRNRSGFGHHISQKMRRNKELRRGEEALLSVSVSHRKVCLAFEAEKKEAYAKTCWWGRYLAQVWSKTTISGKFSKYIEGICWKHHVWPVLRQDNGLESLVRVTGAWFSSH